MTEPSRLSALRDYFKEVVRDLVSHGIIRHKRGEALEAILAASADKFLSELVEDLKKIGFEMGSALAQSFFKSAFNHLFGQSQKRR